MYLLSEERHRLAQFGYYAAEGYGVTHYELLKEVDSLPVGIHESAIERYQEFFKDSLDGSSNTVHRRDLEVDGLWGPCCHAELMKARCMVPDHFTAEEAEEQGNWPTNCRNELTTSYKPGMTLRGLDGEQGIKDMINESLRNWEDAIEMNVTLVSSDRYPNTHVHIKAAVLGGSVLADQYLAISSCNFRSQGRMDSNRTWSSALAVATRTHEDGHAWGLGHSRSQADVMFPSIVSGSIQRRGKPSSGDISAMVRLGYKIRTGSPPTDPTDPSNPGAVKVTIERKGEEKITIYGVEF